MADPLDVADLAAWGKLGALSPADETLAAAVIDAVDAHLADRYTLEVDGTSILDRADIRLARLMWAARLWKRRNSPEGVAGFGDLGVIRISRTDPDLAALLEPYARVSIA